MQLRIASTLLFFIITTNCRVISHNCVLGIFHFDATTSRMQTEIEHINSPMILYSLIRMEAASYFSYHSWHQKTDGYPNDTFSILVSVGEINQFALTLQYMILEAMPNLEIASVNFTAAKPSKIYHSMKNLSFNQNTFLSGHIVGFSCHKFAHDSYFFAIKGSHTYHIYTMLNLTADDWLAIRVIIIQSFYQKQRVFCSGSHIDSFHQISNSSPSRQIEDHSDLKFIVGIQAIYQEPVSFRFLVSQKKVQTHGTYSFSVIAINTTCIEMEETVELSFNSKIYLTISVVMIALVVIMSLGFCSYCLFIKYCQQKYEDQCCFKAEEDSSTSESLPEKVEQMQKLGRQLENKMNTDNQL